MENNITAGEKFMSGKVIELVSFLAYRLTKKNTIFGFRSKFMRDMHISIICKMRIRRDLAIKSFKRSLLGKKWCGKMINQMDSSENTLCPKTQREMGLKMKGVG